MRYNTAAGRLQFGVGVCCSTVWRTLCGVTTSARDAAAGAAAGGGAEDVGGGALLGEVALAHPVGLIVGVDARAVKLAVGILDAGLLGIWRWNI